MGCPLGAAEVAVDTDAVATGLPLSAGLHGVGGVGEALSVLQGPHALGLGLGKAW